MIHKFPKIIAALNILLFAYLLYLVNQQHQNKANSGVAGRQIEMQSNSAADAEKGDPKDLLPLIEDRTVVFEHKLKAITDMPDNIIPKFKQQYGEMLKQGAVWRGYNDFQQFQLQDAAFKLFMKLNNHSKVAMDVLFSIVQDTELPIYSRDAALRYIFLNFNKIIQSTEADEIPNKIVMMQPYIADIMAEADKPESAALLGTCLEGLIYLRKNPNAEWNFGPYHSKIVAAIADESLAESIRVTGVNVAVSWKLARAYPAIEKMARNASSEMLERVAIAAAFELNPEATRVWLERYKAKTFSMQLEITKLLNQQ